VQSVNGFYGITGLANGPFPAELDTAAGRMTLVRVCPTYVLYREDSHA
jgi:hypothetical protein